MTQKDLIRAEIERRIAGYDDAYARALKGVLSFIDSLPEEAPKYKSNTLFNKCVENCDPETVAEVNRNVDKMLLDEEWKRYMDSCKDDMSGHAVTVNIKDVARHFAEWGAEHFRDSTKMISEDLEEAADDYADKHGFRVPYDGSNNYYDDVDVRASKEGFIAGAEWQREQILKDAVEGEVVQDLKGRFHVKTNAVSDILYHFGDKVKVIILPKK